MIDTNFLLGILPHACVYAVCRASSRECVLKETPAGQVLSSIVLALIEEPLINMLYDLGKKGRKTQHI